MTDTELISKDLDTHITSTHKRFQKAMQARLPTMQLESKERYFAVLSVMVAQLEDLEKPLRDVLQDVMMEAAPHIAQEISGQ
jgi:hypothetical protein